MRLEVRPLFLGLPPATPLQLFGDHLRMLPLPMLKNLKREKPWAKLRLTRKQYEAQRPWAKAGMDRKRWEDMILLFPDDAIEALYREAAADRLVEAMFGKM